MSDWPYRVPTGSLIVCGGAGGIGQAVIALAKSRIPALKCGVIDVARPAVGHTTESDAAILYVSCDLSDPTATRNAARELEDGLGPVEWLVNASGVSVHASALEIDFNEWRRIIGTHLDATFNACQSFGAGMVARGTGAVVNLSSVSEFFGYPDRVAYAAAKAAISSLTRTLAVEWAGSGVRVNTVAPGYVHTPMTDRSILAGKFDEAPIAELHALNRFAAPNEIAEPIVFLLSSGASFITGATLMVDGGFTALKIGGTAT